MNIGCGSPVESERSVRGVLENEDDNERGLGRSAEAMEWSVDNLPRTPGSITAPKQWFCLFRGDTGPMGVTVQSVAEVLETDTLVRLPWSPPQVLGMCSFHREVIPIVVFGPLPRDFPGRSTGRTGSGDPEKLGRRRSGHRCAAWVCRLDPEIRAWRMGPSRRLGKHDHQSGIS